MVPPSRSSRAATHARSSCACSAASARLAAATVLGGTVLADASPSLVGTAQAVAAGAVLAVISIAIVPHAFSELSSRVATAAVFGFIVGYLLA
jgi:zinc transporter ZupT